MLAEQDDDEHWNGLLWALVAEDDLPAAYWLICSRAAAGHAHAVPAELLVAVQGADWLLDAPSKFEDDLLTIVERVDPGTDDSRQLLTLAASLGPTLFAPYSDMHPWLQVPSTCPELNELVKTVGQFGQRGVAVQEDDLHGNEGMEKLNRQLLDLSAKARETLDSKQTQKLQFKRATDVWRRLLSPSGALHELLAPVGQDRRDDLETLDRLLARSKHKTYLTELIDGTDSELTDGKARSHPIVGKSPQPAGKTHPRCLHNCPAMVRIDQADADTGQEKRLDLLPSRNFAAGDSQDIAGCYPSLAGTAPETVSGRSCCCCALSGESVGQTGLETET